MKNKYPLLLIFVLIIPVITFSQIVIPEDLKSILQDKNDFYSIQKIVHSYYDQKIQSLSPSDSLQRKQLNRQLKFWNRWEWYQESRLGPDNKFVNITEKLFEASQEIKNKYGTNRVNNAGQSSGDWIQIGPEQIINYPNINDGIGRIDRLAFHPTNPNIIYAGSPSGGLWKNAYGGTGNNWEPISDDIAYMGISGIVIDKINPDIIYILTGDGDSYIDSDAALVKGFNYTRPSIGVLKSVDGGLNWNRTGNFPGVPSVYYGYKLIQSPVNTNILLAATNTGIFRTSDAGNSWSKVSPDNNRYFDLEFKPGSSDTVYACTKDTFYRSVNAGLSFSKSGISFDIPYTAGSMRLAIGVSNAAPELVYLLVEGWDVDTTTFDFYYKGLYQSQNSGTNFYRKSNYPNIFSSDSLGQHYGSMGDYGLGLAISHANPIKLATGGFICWRSVDGGSTMINSSVYSTNNASNPKYVHPDIHDLAYNPLSNILYCTNDGGIWRSINDGQSWERIFGNLQTTQIYHMKGVATDMNRLLLGTQDNGIIYKKDATNTYYATIAGDGFSSAFNPVNADTFYCTVNSSLFKCINNGDSVRFWINTGSFFSSVTYHITKPEILMYGNLDGIYRSGNYGNNFGITNGKGYWSLVNCPSNGARFYGAGGFSLFGDSVIKKVSRSDDEGQNWVDISGSGSGLLTGLTDPKITCLGVNPSTSAQVWATYGGFVPGQKVYYSSDLGGTWINRSGSLPNIPVNCIAVDNTGAAYIGTDLGVFYWSISLNDWVPFYNDLPQTPVTDLIIYPSQGKIRASTFGRGVWESPTWNICDINLTINQPLGGQQFFEASNSINSAAIISSGSGTNVYFRAGNNLIFFPGFEVKEGSFFKGYLGPCASGIPTQSRLYQQYGVKELKDILITEPIMIKDYPQNSVPETNITDLDNNGKEISISVPEKQFVQVWLEDIDHEILFWLVQENLIPGQYKTTIKTEKFKKNGIAIKIKIGNDEISTYTL